MNWSLSRSIRVESLAHLSHRRSILLGLFLLTLALSGCGSPAQENTLFSFLPPNSTGVTFENQVTDGPRANLLTYENFYNGGGVAAGDVNGDDRPDLYLTANQDANALYLNDGEFHFREVTRSARVADTSGWKTGVTMADVNGDGRLDLYVAHAGPPGTKSRHNKLYINQGSDGDSPVQFQEKAEAYGLDDPGYTTHATFFDYDRDGDLDAYVLNNQPPGSDMTRRLGGDRLYRHDTTASGGHTFVDVSEEAGLTDGIVGHGLSVTASDINRDGWPDLYVANDFSGEDRLLINQGDGSFSDEIHSWMRHMPTSSMGVDIADYDNDLHPDIFALDMLAEGNRRQKLLAITPTPRFQDTPQYTRNMLQLHNGNGTFSEIGQLAGVSNTDWSWAALFADFDLDGSKDLYVTNGVPRDQTNLDFQYRRGAMVQQERGRDPDEIYALLQKIPSTPIANYAFRNEADLTFAKTSRDWGVDQKGFSNGAAYADFDGDGDLDLVTNNVNERTWLYRNHAVERTDHRYLRVRLAGAAQNPFGVGATVTLKTPDGRTQYQEMMPVRGFQSSVEPVLTFGLDSTKSVDVQVTWPDRARQSLADVAANQTVTLYRKDASPAAPKPDPPPETPLTEASPSETGLLFSHQENPFRDFRHEPLLPHKLSELGPALARGDVNGDGRTDIFVGGGRGQAAALFVQQTNGSFVDRTPSALASHQNYEDVDATFFDADGDGDQDLYVVSGGSSEVRADAYQDRLYLNTGSGILEQAGSGALPTIESSGGAVAAHDYDGDGDQDLFVGGRVRPTAYPLPPRSYVLENTGGRFEDATDQVSRALMRPGLVTDAVWSDVTGDDTSELIITGEWMGLRVFRPSDGTALIEVTDSLGLGRSNGWWNSLAVADLDGDGDRDIVGGNRGENAQFHARPDAPASVYAGDFDQDGSVEPILSHYIGDTEYPLPRRDQLVNELPLLRSRFQTYEAYAEATMQDLLSEEQWKEAQRFRAHTFTTSLFEQREDGTFVRRDLPVEAQFSPTHDIVVHDADEDGRPDLLLAGNDFSVPEPWGPSDAGQGVLLINRGDLTFDVQRARESGFFAPGEVRGLLVANTPKGALLLVGNNDASLKLFRFHRRTVTRAR